MCVASLVEASSFSCKSLFFLWSILSSSVVIASKNCYHTEQAVLWRDNQSAFEKVDSSDEIVTEQSTYIHENILSIAVCVSIPKTPGRHPGEKKNTNRDQAKKILKFELLKKKKTMLKKCKIMVVSSWDGPTVCFYWYFKFLVTLNHYSFTLIRCLLILMM